MEKDPKILEKTSVGIEEFLIILSILFIIGLSYFIFFMVNILGYDDIGPSITHTTVVWILVLIYFALDFFHVNI